MSNVNIQMQRTIEQGDFRNEDEDEYVKMLEADSKKNLFVKVAVGAVYVVLLVVSLFVV
jgi:hypothetical protein